MPGTAQSARGAARRLQRALHDEQLLLATIAQLETTDEITAERAARLRALLGQGTATTSYILRNLAVHLGIGAGRLAVPVPIIPVASVLRGSWVALARATETTRRRPDYARIHSLETFLIACVPGAGYLAYIVALRRHDPDLALLYANHLAMLLSHRTLEETLQNKPRPLRRLVRRVVGTSRDD